MRVLVGVLGAALVAAMLMEIFVAYLLPRRVKRDPRIVRTVSQYGWRPWRAAARRLPAQLADTMLGVYGPLALLLNLLLWVAGIIIGYACLHWAAGSHLGSGPAGNVVGFGDDLYFAAATMTTDGPSTLAAHTTFARLLQVLDAGTGLVVLAIVISYLPSLYQAFSRREATVSQLDARAGSPPSAAQLVLRSAHQGGWPELGEYLGGWETWVAELMETHLSYPGIAYFRSQHVNQNWVAAICCVLDTSALAIVCAPKGSVEPARFTYAIARHAVVDLSYTFRVDPAPPASDRLPRAELHELLEQLRAAGIEPAVGEDQIAERLTFIRGRYEPYVNALAQRLELNMPQWLAPESPTDNWRGTEWH